MRFSVSQGDELPCMSYLSKRCLGRFGHDAVAAELVDDAALGLVACHLDGLHLGMARNLANA